MHKIISITVISIITVIFTVIIFLTTIGFKTNNFNGLINEKINKINPKIKLKLNEVNFKLNLTNFEFEIFTLDPKIAVNGKKVDLETIKFDLNVFDYLNNRNPISGISIISKDNNISQLTDFINEYDFNLARIQFLIKSKGENKNNFQYNFDENNPKNIKYIINGSVTDAEIKLLTVKN